jgi:hypothetical protein
VVLPFLIWARFSLGRLFACSAVPAATAVPVARSSRSLSPPLGRPGRRTRPSRRPRPHCKHDFSICWVFPLYLCAFNSSALDVVLILSIKITSLVSAKIGSSSCCSI